MPRHPIHILGQTLILELVHHTAPQVVVVIEDPDLCVQSPLLDRGAEVILHEVDLVLLPPYEPGYFDRR
jgi:hypothetical protein